ncbi:hypothetical protein BDW75DRAFT_247743 [Aspergillus navahoensis]
MAMSFAAAVQADGDVLAESPVEEENASKDRDIARRRTDDGMNPSDDETLAKLQILYLSNIEERGRCVACRERTDFVSVVRVPCQHDTRKEVEFETPNRTYCYFSDCGSFINTSYINDKVATCPDYRHTTCTSCKRRAYPGKFPVDTALQQLLTTAQENGCWRLVELDHGCNNLTFHGLLVHAYQIIDREANQPAAADPPPDIDEPLPEEPSATVGAPAFSGTRTPRGLLIARTIQKLRDNHECRHKCFYHPPEYIFDMSQCRIQACNRCRRNRL